MVLARRSSVARRPGIARLLRESGVEIVAAPRVDSNLLLGVDADVYVNMAGAIDKPSGALWEAHVELTRRIVEAAVHRGSRVVYTSAVAAVGRLPGVPRGGRVVDGDPRDTRGVPESVYEETKAKGEDVVALADGLRGKWCIARPGLVVGRNPSHAEWRLLSTVMKLRVAPSLGWEAPVTHALDLARVYAACIEGRLDGLAVHAVSYHVDLGELALTACRLRGLRCHKVPVGLLLRIAGPLAPGASRARIAYLMYRRGYKYVSLHAGRVGVPATTPRDAAEVVASELLG
ncbi:hypothetical protein JCM10135_04190 [Stetteria hydrogenophila]